MQGMVRRVFVGVAVALLFVARAGAEQPKPVEGAEVSLAGIDAVDAAMKRGGFDGYAGLMTRLLEDLPFLGKGAVDTGGPLGISYLADDDLTPQAMGLFLLPVKGDAAQLKPWRERGLKQLPGHADTVAAPNGFAIRRTASHVLFGGNSGAVADAAVDKLGVPYKEAGALAHAHVDVAAYRTASPRRFAGFLDQMVRDDRAKNPAEAFGGQVVRDWIRNTMESAELTLLGDTEHLTFRLRLAPCGLKPVATKLPRPAFPEGCLGRADLVYPAAETIPFVTRFFVVANHLADNNIDKSGVIERELPGALNPLIGDSVSVGVERTDGAPGTYASTQFAEAPDVRGELKSLSERFGDAFKMSTYTDGELTVTRMAAIDHGKTVFYADFVPDGKRLTVAFSAGDGKYVARAARLKPAGEISGLLSGEVDMAATRKLVAGLPAGKLDAGQKGMLAELLKGDKIRFAARNDGRALELNLTGPISWLGTAMKMAPLPHQ
jgi:hypothetical protein